MLPLVYIVGPIGIHCRPVGILDPKDDRKIVEIEGG